MLSNNLSVRTPSHFSKHSLIEAVAVANINEPAFYDKPLTRLFTSLHNAQGIIHPNIDLTSRINKLAVNAEPMKNKQVFVDTLTAHLFGKLYVTIFSPYEQFKTASDSLVETDFSTLNEDNKKVLAEIHSQVNEAFNAHLSAWGAQLKVIDKAQRLLTEARNRAGNLERAYEKLEEATRKGKNIESAQKSVAKAEADAALVKKATQAVEAEQAKLGLLIEMMKPIRLLETVSRSLKIFSSEKSLTVDESLDAALYAFNACSKFFPETFENSVTFADSLLKP